MCGYMIAAAPPLPPAPRVMPMEMRQNLQTADAHRREHDISSTLCAEDCGQRIGAGLGMAWRLTSEPSSAPAHAPPAKIDYRPPATSALGSALGSEDVGRVGGVLLDLGAFFAGELRPEGQVGRFFRRPCSLKPFSRCSGPVKRHSWSAAEIDFHGPEGFVLIAAGVFRSVRRSVSLLPAGVLYCGMVALARIDNAG